MTTAEILKAARELISDPAQWTQGTEARDAAGVETDLASGEAVCWCAVGALGVVDQGWDTEARLQLDLHAGGDATHFNDTHSHAEVLAAFDRAIAATRA